VSSNGQRQVLHTRKNRVVVAMSGGVDSSVAAHLLQRISQKSSSYHPGTGGGDKISTTNKSVDIVGLHMSNWNALDEDASTTESMRRQSAETSSVSPKPSSNGTNFCQTSENEYNDAKSVAQHLDIPLHRVSFASEYWIQVFEPFIESLSSSSSSLSGEEEEDFITNNNNRHPQLMTTPMPNPDYGCNTYIKFGAMRDYAMNTLNADYVATGHYAQLWHRDYLTSSTGYRSKHCESSSLFHQWIAETSKSLEHQVLDSIRGRPEEDWILNNHLKQLTSSIGSSSDVVAPLPMLLAGADRSKDQTYFLSGVKGKAFRNVIFPLGHLAKSQQSCTQLNHNNSSSNNNLDQTVRDIAEQANIPTASKRDSMGICFIGKRNFGQFVTQYLPETPRPGNFVDVDTGEIVGRHEGAVRYTLGEGAKISGAKLRYFVCGKGRTVVSGDGDDGNTVFVCNSTHHPALYADELFVDFDAFNWIGLGDGDAERGKYTHVPRPLVEGDSIRLLARVRHLQPLTTCTVTWIQSDNKSSSGDKGHLVVRFDKAMRAITPGQIVALYAGFDGLVCLGGGIISGRGDSYMNRGLDVTAGMLHPSGSNDLSLRLP
jgi:tRNA U34 2-thiouridine synthase MnmA/TrmU